MERDLVVLLVVVANAVVLVLGGVVTHLAYRAYRRTGTRELRALGAGFGLITLGLLAGGGLHQVVGADVLAGVAVQSAATAVGFGLVIYSLYARDVGSPGGR
ncbi:MAG: hypothetical protein ABEJ04_01685 [Halobacteriaceae archaeon]